jgi:hypothetical protein
LFYGFPSHLVLAEESQILAVIAQVSQFCQELTLSVPIVDPHARENLEASRVTMTQIIGVAMRFMTSAPAPWLRIFGRRPA